ncbi:MAG: ATP synthase F1 subunit delta [Candidatus Dormibacteraceae bacterium]
MALAVKRYARATFELAQSTGQIEAWRHDLGRLEQSFAIDPLRQLIADQSLSSERRRAAALDLQIDGIQPEVLNLGRLVIESGMGSIKEIVEEFSRLADRVQNRIQVLVTTVPKLAEPERIRLAERLSRILNREVHLELSQDATILGGMVLRIGDRLIDASLRGRLRQLRRALI